MKKNDWFILLGVTTVHFLLKLFFPDDIGLWYNEVMNVLNTQKSWAEVLETNTTQQIQPLYLILLTAWTKIVGLTDDNLRLLSILFSTATAFSVSFLAMKHFKENVMIYATLLFLVSGLDLHYSHEIQFYSLSSLLVVWSFYFFFEIWEKNNWISAISLLIINALLLYVHPLTSLVLVIQLIVPFSLAWKQKGILVKIVMAQIVAFLIYIPWLLRIFSEKYQLIQVATWTDLKNGLVEMAMGMDMLIVYAILFLVVGIGTIFYHLKNKTTENTQLVKTLTLILWVFFPIIISFLMALFMGKSFFFQNVLYVTIGFVLLVGYLLESLPVPQMYKMIPFAILILVLLTRLEIKNYNHQDIKKAIVASQKVLKENGAVFLQTADIDVLFAYYYDQKLLFSDYKNIRERLKAQHIYVGNDATWMKYQELKNYTKVLLIQSFEGYTDPQGTLVKKFSEVFKQTGFNNSYLGIRLYEYTPIEIDENNLDELAKVLPKIQEEEKILGMLEVINKKEDWLQRVILKAKEKNISVEIMKCLDAVFVLKDEYPQFKKYKEDDILLQVKNIQQNATWIAEIQTKATEKKVPVEVMTFLDALYVLQEENLVFQQKTQEKFVAKCNYIKNNPTWKKEISKKAQERNISEEMMTGIDALYTLINEDDVFKTYKQEMVLLKIKEIQSDEKWLKEVEKKATLRQISKEIMLFLEAIYALYHP